MTNEAGWTFSRDEFPKEGEQVLILDYTHKDVLIDWCVFREGLFYLLIGACLGIPQYWRRDVKLPDVVLNTIKES